MRRDATQWFSDQHATGEVQCNEITSWLALDRLPGS
jgi:hypothetical protein